MVNAMSHLLRFLLSHWEKKLRAFLTLVFLLQFVSWFAAEEGFWWPETASIVRFSLYLAFAVELFPQLNMWVRRSAQFLLIFIANVVYCEYRPVWLAVHSLRDARDWLYDNVGQLYPFIWFGIGAWLIYVALMWWMGSRRKIVAATMLAVLALAIRDSFSEIYLWQETAMVIVCGLLLLVVCHFLAVKRRNPAGWAHLAEYPAVLLVTIGVLVGITIVPALLVPSVRPLATDPYTAYQEWRGRTVPEFGKVIPVGDAIFTTGSSSSGYSQDDSKLGGGFDFDYTPVFTVDTTRRSYWRGETRSYYTGSGWEKSKSDGRFSSVPINGPLNKEARFDSSLLQTVTVRQTVNMLSDDSYPVLFGGFSISKVISLNGEEQTSRSLTWLPRNSELRWNESRDEYPSSYVIESEIPIIDEEALALALASPPSTSQLSEYLQLPAELPDRVGELAQEIVSGASSSYEKAKLLEQYLRLNFSYTSKPRTELGISDDFVDRFLFEIKEGYCDYYSTAMAVLSRSVGIPSRWVKGYVSGSSRNDDMNFGAIPESALRDPDGGGVYTVRNSDAHSWVELYFHGYGWIPFEPTSGFVLPVLAAEEDEAAPTLPETDTPNVVPLPAAPISEGDGKHTGGVALFAIGAALLLLASAAAVYSLRRYRFRRALSFFKLKRVVEPKDRIAMEYSRLLKLYRRRGFPLIEYETARETVMRLKERDKRHSEELDQLLALFEKAKYSSRSITQEDWGKAVEIVNKLKKAM